MILHEKGHVLVRRSHGSCRRVSSGFGLYSRPSFGLRISTGALLFLAGGIGSGKFLKMRGGEISRELGKGALNMLPGILLILMAMSVPHIMTRGGVMDSILFQAARAIQGTGSYLAGFLVYLLTLFLNFFISSASAKAFLVMQYLHPWRTWWGLPDRQWYWPSIWETGFPIWFFPQTPFFSSAWDLRWSPIRNG